MSQAELQFRLIANPHVRFTPESGHSHCGLLVIQTSATCRRAGRRCRGNEMPCELRRLRGSLGGGNLLFRSQCKVIEQQLLLPPRPSCRVSGMSPYKPHHRGVQLKGLNLVFLVRRHRRNFKEVRHPSDGASSVYGRHRIAVVDFNFVSIHLLHCDAYREGGTPFRATADTAR